MNTGLILFAHGARDVRWAAPFEAVAAHLRAEKPELHVRLAFLELMAPSLPQAGAELAAQGCGHLHVLPMFLGAGGHVRVDLPRLVEELRASHPDLLVTVLPAVGEIDSVAAAMAQAALVLVGSTT